MSSARQESLFSTLVRLSADATTHMNTVKEKILSYPHLSPSEQREVEGYVEDHPEWGELLRTVRTLEELARTAEVLEGSEKTESSLLANYVVLKHLSPGSFPAALREPFARLEQQIEHDAELRAQVETMRQRVESAEASVDASTHFEELTGHRLSAEDAPVRLEENGTAAPAPPAGSPSAEGRDHSDDRPPAGSSQRDEVATRILSGPARWAMAAVVLVFALYGGLYAASWASQSTLDRLARVDVDEDVVESYQPRLRSPMATTARNDTTPDDLYLQALPLLRSARTSTLGLFPHVDHRKLREAEGLLRRVVDQTDSGSFLQLEAHFYLGKINLSQGEVEAAREHFKIVVRQEGRRTTEAYQILKRLEETYPAAPSGA